MISSVHAFNEVGKFTSSIFIIIYKPQNGATMSQNGRSKNESILSVNTDLVQNHTTSEKR